MMRLEKPAYANMAEPSVVRVQDAERAALGRIAALQRRLPGKLTGHMLTDRQFRHWIDFLQHEILALNELYLAHTGEPYAATAETIAFLKMNDCLVKEGVERAVSVFAKHKAWPHWLNTNQIVNLTHRGTLAHGLLTMMQNGQLMHAHALPMPKSKDRAEVLRWIFVELWQYGGAEYLDGLTNSYFVDDSPQTERFG